MALNVNSTLHIESDDAHIEHNRDQTYHSAMLSPQIDLISRQVALDVPIHLE